MIGHLKYKYANSKFGQKKSSTQFVFLVLFIIIVWFIIGMLFPSKKIEKKKTENSIIVDIKKMSNKNIVSDVLVYGHTEASEKVNLQIRTSGIVEKIFVKKGQRVKKGEIILSLKMEDRIAKLYAAQAAKSKAEIEFNTAKSLLMKDLISKVEFVSSEANYKSACATLEQIRLDVEYTYLRAPFDGIINALDVKVGSYVKKEENIGVFLNLDPIKVVAELPEKYINRLSVGGIASVSLSNNVKEKAVVTYIASIATDSTRTFSVELEAKNTQNKIVEGLTAEIKLPLNSVSSVKLPALSSLTFGEDGSVGVKTVDDENIVHFYSVEIVKEENDGLWVSGIPSDSKVIVSGGEFVKVGEKVKVKIIDEEIEK